MAETPVSLSLSHGEIPVIDLERSDRGEVVRQIGEVSPSYGFFFQPMEEEEELYYPDSLRLLMYGPAVPNWLSDLVHQGALMGEQGQRMVINFFYPSYYPEPDLTYGLPSHADPGAFVINIGDQMQHMIMDVEAGRLLVSGHQERERNSGRIAAYSQRPDLPIVATDTTALATTDDRAQILETALKIGVWATGISVPGFISMLMKGTLIGFRATSSLLEKRLAVACVSAMFTSSILGGVLLLLAIFHSKFSLLIANIKTIIAFAVASMGTVVFTGFALKLCEM